MEKNVKTIVIDNTLAELMAEAADNPYFFIVQKGEKIHSTVTEGFDLEIVLEWIVEYAKMNEMGDEFKEAVADMLLDISKSMVK